VFGNSHVLNKVSTLRIRQHGSSRLLPDALKILFATLLLLPASDEHMPVLALAAFHLQKIVKV